METLTVDGTAPPVLSRLNQLVDSDAVQLSVPTPLFSIWKLFVGGGLAPPTALKLSAIGLTKRKGVVTAACDRADVAIGALRSRHAPLIRVGTGGVVPRIDSRTAVEQGVGQGWPAVIRQGTEFGVHLHLIAIRREGAEAIVGEVVAQRSDVVHTAGAVLAVVVGQQRVGEFEVAVAILDVVYACTLGSGFIVSVCC